MATTTPVFGLRKPATTDLVNVTTDVSDNMAAIDLLAAPLASPTFTGTVTLADTVNVVVNATTGTKIGTATSQKLGFFNATPVIQPTGSSDILVGLVALGLRAATSNPAMNMGSGGLTCGVLTCGTGGTNSAHITDVAGFFGFARATTDGTACNLLGSRVMTTTTVPATLIAGYSGGTGPVLAIQDSGSGTLLLVNHDGSLTTKDAASLVLGTATGLKIATATSQKLAFWNKTPIVQPTTGITAAAFVANTSLTANDSATFGGYTIGQIAAALINVGILA